MSESTIVVTRTVPAPPERVFRAWTDPAAMAAWWWPQLPGTTYDLDVRVGGHYRIHSPTAGITAYGEYVEVDAPRRLVFTWLWEGEGETAVTRPDDVVVTFEPADTGTLVTVAHTSTAHVEGGGAEQGWNDVMDRLTTIRL